MAKVLGGSGGGDDNQKRSAVIAPDSLDSTSIAKVVDLLCEGEIEGLANSDKSIFLNETPLQSSSGYYNFQGIRYDFKTGTQNQTHLSGFNGTESEVSVGVEITSGVSNAVVRTITDPNIDIIRARVSLPSLMVSSTETGDISGTSVDLVLQFKDSVSTTWTTLESRTVRGKSSSKFEFTMEGELTGTAPWDVRIYRTTPDSTSPYLQNKTFFESYVEVIDQKLTMPNSAVIGIQIPSDQFSGIPSRAYELKLLKIKVPSNYNPTTRVYSGVWNGTFQTLWSDNPAWVFYDLITSKRYGLGEFIPESQVDKWALYEIAQYCDELVPDGFGGMEPRFTCNLMIETAEEAVKVIQNLASIFRGIVYWGSGSVMVSQDRPVDPVAIYSPANVVDGVFLYQSSGQKVRSTVALVSWNDPDDFYRLKVEYVEDVEGINRYGVQEVEVVAFGCTSRGQANRLGRWMLYTNLYETETVGFKVGLEGVVVKPGDVIKVQDPTRAGIRLAGRVSSGTTTAIVIDQELSNDYLNADFSIMLQTGEIEKKTIIGISGFTITLSSALSVAPQNGVIWAVENANIEAQIFRVVAIKEESDGTFSINAISHDPEKFSAIENGLNLEPRNISLLTTAPNTPQNAVISESLYQTGSEVENKVTISWDRVSNATGYQVVYRIDDSNLVYSDEISVNEYEILKAPVGFYDVQVFALNSLGKKSEPANAQKTIFGKTTPPFDVQGFSMIPSAGLAILSWDRSNDLDVLVGGSVRIRHTPRLTAQAWKDGVDIVPGLAGTATSATVPLLSGTYMIKFIDSSGNFSLNEKMITTSIPDFQALNIVETLQESPAFSGVKNDLVVDSVEGRMFLNSETLIDDVSDFDSIGTFDFNGGIKSYGFYSFASVVDLGGVWPSRIRSVVDLEAFDIGDLFDFRTANVDDWADFDGVIINDVDAQIWVRTTDDNPSGSPTWSDWKRVTSAEYTARGFQFELRCYSNDPNHGLYINDLSVTLDQMDRVESIPTVASGTGAYAVTFQNEFFEAPVVSVTALNMSSGDYYTITGLTSAGFTIQFRNSAGTGISRNFSALAKGFGLKVG